MNTIVIKSIGTILGIAMVCLPTTLFLDSADAYAHEMHESAVDSVDLDLENQLLALMPENLDVRIVLRDGYDLVDQLRTISNSPTLQETGLITQLTSKPEFIQARLMLLGVASAANTNAWEAVGSVLGDCLAIGIDFNETGTHTFILISASNKSTVRDRVINQVMTFVTGVDSSKIKPNQIVSIGNAFCTHTDEGFIVVSNDRDLISPSKSDSQQILTPLIIPDDATIWIQSSETFIDYLLHSNGNFSTKPTEPLLGFLFGDWLYALDNSTTGLAWFTLKNDSITFSTVIDSDKPMPLSHRGFQNTLSYGTDIWSGQSVDGYASQLVISRDWAELFSEREVLLDGIGSAQAVDFTSTLTALMGGLDVMDEILPAISGPINLIVARQNFESLGITPNPQLPAFALITPIDVTVTKNLAQRLRSGTLSALSIISMEMSNNNQQAYTIAMDKHRDIDIVWTQYQKSDSSEDDPNNMMLGPQYNFAPCSAVIGDHFVISTSKQLMNDLIDQSLDKNDSLSVPSHATGALLVESAGVISIFRDNQEAMIASNMLDKNNSKAEASHEIELLIKLVDLAKDLTVTSAPTKHGGVQATIELRFKDSLLRVQ